MIFTPSKVAVLRIRAAAEHLTIKLCEVGVLVAELSNLSRAYKGEVEWPEEDYLPLSLIGRFGDGLELFALIKRDACFKGE
jgi:hypothetical protein